MVSAGLSEGGIGRLQIAHINCGPGQPLGFKCGVLSSSPNVVEEHMWPNGWMCMVHVKVGLNR